MNSIPTSGAMLPVCYDLMMFPHWLRQASNVSLCLSFLCFTLLKFHHCTSSGWRLLNICSCYLYLFLLCKVSSSDLQKHYINLLSYYYYYGGAIMFTLSLPSDPHIIILLCLHLTIFSPPPHESDNSIVWCSSVIVIVKYWLLEIL